MVKYEIASECRNEDWSKDWSAKGGRRTAAVCALSYAPPHLRLVIYAWQHVYITDLPNGIVLV